MLAFVIAHGSIRRDSMPTNARPDHALGE